MADRPIIFSGPMVRALLEGRKTQTRRVIKPGDIYSDISSEAAEDFELRGWSILTGDDGYMDAFRGTSAVGDRLWVREVHSLHDTHGQHRADGLRWGPWGGLPTTISPDGAQIAYYREGFDRSALKRWRPSIHMPRWASRLTLTVTDVRVQRLQEISEEDAVTEGVCAFVEQDDNVPWGDMPAVNRNAVVRAKYGSAVKAYLHLWETINGSGAWALNPWVAAYSFTVHGCNIDQMGAAHDRR